MSFTPHFIAEFKGETPAGANAILHSHPKNSDKIAGTVRLPTRASRTGNHRRKLGRLGSSSEGGGLLPDLNFIDLALRTWNGIKAAQRTRAHPRDVVH